MTLRLDLWTGGMTCLLMNWGWLRSHMRVFLHFPHKTHTANSWYDLFFPLFFYYFHHSITSMQSRAFYHSFWAVTQSGTYDINTWYASLKSHVDQLWYQGCEVAVHPTPTQCFETRQALQLYLRLPSIKQNYVEMEFFFFFYLCSLGSKKNSNLSQIKLEEKTVGASAWQGQGTFHYNQIDVEWLSS